MCWSGIGSVTDGESALQNDPETACLGLTTGPNRNQHAAALQRHICGVNSGLLVRNKCSGGLTALLERLVQQQQDVRRGAALENSGVVSAPRNISDAGRRQGSCLVSVPH